MFSRIGAIIFISLTAILAGCYHAEYIVIKVPGSAFPPTPFETYQDSLLVHGYKIGFMAQRYYNRPGSLAGGNNTFTGFTIMPCMKETDYGIYTLTKVESQSIVMDILGKETGFDCLNPLRLQMYVSPTGIGFHRTN